MNLDYLRTYLEVVKLGSFSEVAKKLNISQPAVSFQVQKLERELGVRLFDRTQRTITPTVAGKRLLRFAGLVGEEWERLHQDLDELREDVTGELLIAASTIPGECLLSPLLSEFRTLHPAVKAQVAVSDSLSVIHQVEAGSYDVGFCGLAPDGGELESFPVAGDEIVLIVFPEHPFAGREEVSLTDLEKESFIFREETSGTQRNLEALLAREGFSLRHWSAKLVLGTSQAVISAVEAGAGIAFVSSLAIKRSLALGTIRTVKVSGLYFSRDFYCIYRTGRIVSRLLEEFLAFVRAEASRAGKGK